MPRQRPSYPTANANSKCENDWLAEGILVQRTGQEKVKIADTAVFWRQNTYANKPNAPI